MTADQMWAAFRKLDSGATIQVVKAKHWRVVLPGVLYDGPHFLSSVAGVEVVSRGEAIVATWNI